MSIIDFNEIQAAAEHLGSQWDGCIFRDAVCGDLDIGEAIRAALERTLNVEHTAQQWDGCMYEAVGEDIDVGAAIRSAYANMPRAEAVTQRGCLP